MKTLIVMRHGHAENWAGSDFARRLTPDGLAAVGAAAAVMRGQGLRPELVLCSAAARALQTAERVAAALDVGGECVTAERSFYHIDDYGLMREIRHTGDEFGTLLVVGHNPAVSVLAAGFAGNTHSMRPAEFVVLTENGDRWREFGARIVSVRYF